VIKLNIILILIIESKNISTFNTLKLVYGYLFHFVIRSKNSLLYLANTFKDVVIATEVVNIASVSTIIRIDVTTIEVVTIVSSAAIVGVVVTITKIVTIVSVVVVVGIVIASVVMFENVIEIVTIIGATIVSRVGVEVVVDVDVKLLLLKQLLLLLLLLLHSHPCKQKREHNSMT